MQHLNLISVCAVAAGLIATWGITCAALNRQWRRLALNSITLGMLLAGVGFGLIGI